MEYTLDQQRALAMANARKRQAIAMQQSPQPQEQTPREDQNFFERVGSDVDKRARMAGEIQQATKRGEQTKPEEIFQLAGKAGAGLANDVAGEAITSILRGAGNTLSFVTPDSIEQPIKKYFSPDPNSPPSGFEKFINGAEQKYDQFSQEHPRLMRNVESAGNMVGFGAPYKGQSLATAVDAGLETGVKGIAKGAAKTGTGIKNATDAVVSGVKAATPEETDQVARKLSMEASDLYKQSREIGATLNKNRAASIYNKMQDAVLSGGKLNARLHGDTISVLGDIRDAVKSGNPISLEELDQHRQLLDDVIRKNTDVAGKLNPDAFRAVQAKEALDDSVRSLNKIDIVGGNTEAVDLLLKGRAKWAQKSKYEAVARVIKKANGDPAKIKSGFERFVNDPRKIKGFTKDEIKALKVAGNNSMSEKVLKGLGRFGIEPGNVYLPIVTGGLGALGGVATGTGALVGAGTVARQANKFVARGKADKVLKTIKVNE